MKLSDFDYHLPCELIAQYPLKKRDHARLMILDRVHQTITHDHFLNIGRYLPLRSLLVANDSKVVAARLLGRLQRTGREVEIFLLDPLEGAGRYHALLRPLKKIRYDDSIIFDGTDLCAKLIDHEQKIVQFNKKNVMAYLKKIGHMPLPPYIHRGDESSDKKDYQTVYARHPGSVAAPTAGLHFTHKILNDLQRAGHQLAKVTLHVGYGTFRPVQEEDITRHQMHSEDYDVSSAIIQRMKKAKAKGQKIVAVGTTSCRVLESYGQTGKLQGSTNLFVYPGFSFKMVDILLTNFHLPKSTLLMLVCAFASTDFVMKAYQEAIKERYRFYSYGDCMLIK